MDMRLAPRRLAALSLLSFGTALFAFVPAANATIDDEDRNPVASIEVTKDDKGVSVPETEGTVTYFVTVENTGDYTVTLTKATDIIISAGNFEIDITEQGGVVLDTTCQNLVGTVLEVEESYNCRFTIPFRGNAGDVKVDKLTVWANYSPRIEQEEEEYDTVDTESRYTIHDSDTEETPMTDVLPTMVVDKSDNNASATAPGSNVVYTVNVTNTSVEPITITGVWDEIDDIWYDLSKVAHPVIATTCNSLIGKVLPVNGSAGCTFTFYVAGAAGTIVTDGVKVIAEDDEDNEIRIYDHESTPIVAPAPTTTQPTTTQPPTTQPTTTKAPTTTVQAASETTVVASSVEPQVAVLGTTALAVTGRDSAQRAALGSIVVGLGVLFYAVELTARRRRAERI